MYESARYKAATQTFKAFSLFVDYGRATLHSYPTVDSTPSYTSYFFAFKLTHENGFIYCYLNHRRWGQKILLDSWHPSFRFPIYHRLNPSIPNRTSLVQASWSWIDTNYNYYYKCTTYTTRYLEAPFESSIHPNDEKKPHQSKGENSLKKENLIYKKRKDKKATPFDLV